MSKRIGFEVIALEPECAPHLEKLHAIAFEPGWSASEFRTHMENEFDDVLGVLNQESVAGFIVIRTQVDQSEILTIVVEPGHRGQGFGKKLLAEAERMARTRGADIIFLDVAADNPTAQALYQITGYQRCGTRKAYYRLQKGRVDALLLQKNLS
jgi:ribosomal-protein-alanine N-acetyltransferase